MRTRISILVENKAPFSLNLNAEHGLSVLIERGDDVTLFDTGQTGAALHNGSVLKKPIRRISRIVLSHGHYDHTGGLAAFLEFLPEQCPLFFHPWALNEKVSVDENGERHYSGPPVPFVELERNYNARLYHVEGFQQIAPGIHVLTSVPRIHDWETISPRFKVKIGDRDVPDTFEDDLSLIVETEDGPVLLLGCAHRGIVNILHEFRRLFGRDPVAVFGGSHLQSAPKERVDRTLKFVYGSDIILFAPNHCTGADALDVFRSELPDRYRDAPTGSDFIFGGK